MDLKPGAKLGPYEIVSAIGCGGMGEVWKARDTRLNRDVAIKTSRLGFSGRFQKEAEAVAALNHPNICTLYDVGPDYLVMEFIEGATLADRIAQGAIPLNEALGIAGQIADALEAAHEKNIVHRDLKPANVKIRPDGSVKVLDFGLARIGETAETTGDSPTLLTLGTQAGMILGTAGYMSPEQARGQVADKRADIWAFGVVLYEMVTGKRLFDGATVTDSLAAILNKEPDLTVAPEKLRRLLARCLEKEARKRLRGIADWQELLSEPVTTRSWSRFGTVGWVVAGVLAAVAGWSWYRTTVPGELKPLVRLEVELAKEVLPASEIGPNTILSPDGTRLVWVSQRKLFTRRLDQASASELAGTQGAQAPFFSPDGKWVAFFAEAALKKISVEGGTPIELCKAAPLPGGGSWGDDDNLIVSLFGNYGLLRVPSAGGKPVELTQRVAPDATHRWPQVLPGSKAVLFTSSTSTTSYERASVEVFTLADHKRKVLQRGAMFGRYLPGRGGNGHLVYLSQGSLFAVAFDASALEFRGTPVRVVEGVSQVITSGFGQFDVSAGGIVIYRTGSSDTGLATVQWLDAAGKTEPLLSKPGVYSGIRQSPDGQRLAWSDGADIWVAEPRRDTATRLTQGAGINVQPRWSPDGRFIAFSDNDVGIFWVRSDGSSQPQLLLRPDGRVPFPSAFSPDGKWLAFQASHPHTQTDISIAPVESDGLTLRAGNARTFLNTAAAESNPRFSPDGRWIAYLSNESGRNEVYVRAVSGNGGRWQISNQGGNLPNWSRDGHQLFFADPSNRIMVTRYSANGDTFVPDKSKPWSEVTRIVLPVMADFEPNRDGSRMIVALPAGSAPDARAQNHVVFLQNFGDELERRVPAR